MNVLIIDNYDSFTYNLAELVAAASGRDPIVLYNDAVAPRELRAMDFDAVILSPGPGHPARTRDFGLCEAILTEFNVPVLGVCLGHQGIAQLAGARVTHAPAPMHGRLSEIFHEGDGLFAGLPSPFHAVRYHSLIAEDLPDNIAVDARTADGLVMGLHHSARPVWGVQFHPESVATEHGARIIENFLDRAGAHTGSNEHRPQRALARRASKPASTRLQLHARPLEPHHTPEDCFARLFADAETAFWLDSSSHASGQGRYSFMGDGRGPLAHTLRYNVAQTRLDRSGRAGSETREQSLFDHLESELGKIELDGSDLPIPFKGGYVGYLGYEMKADCGGQIAHRSPHPDAQLLFADRFIAFDHQTGRAWLAALVRLGEHGPAEDWFDAVETRLGTDTPVEDETTGPPSGRPSAPAWQMRHDRAAYLDRIQSALSKIHDGESYEVCLCNEWRRPYGGDALAAYQSLRRLNPAPYGAFLSFSDLDVLSCSPERMVRMSASGAVDCKPIKGTIARGDTPAADAALKQQLQASEKDRAENLMIVDLIRNDLNRVCQTGTVKVPKLFDIESFASVHQMVSTVTGQLRATESPVSCVRSLFPGGSMTGAPKLRTMEIIDQLEAGPRGVYSGAIGYFSLDGAVDLNIVIRTAVLDGETATIGAGGAIIALSDPDAEFEETMLKGELLRTALDEIEQIDAPQTEEPIQS